MTTSDPLIAVVVVNWNGLEDTRECLQSLLAQTYTNYVIHVVDNGSANGEAEQLAAEFGTRIVLHRSPTNLGFTGGNNLPMAQILAAGQAEYIALLNNDAAAAPQWLAALARDARAHPATGVFASRMLFYDRPNIIENTGVVLLTSGEAMPRHRGCSLSAGRQRSRPIGACGGAVMYRSAMLAEIGLFRDEFFANFEDVDLSLRALARGWDVLYVPDAVVRHKLGRSIAKVRGEAFLLRSQRNLLHAYWVNLPWQVLLANLPWQIVSHAALLGLGTLFGQRQMARVVWQSRVALWRERATIRRARAALAPHRRGGWFRIWWRQRWFVHAYVRSFLDVVVLRRRRFFE
jgi:hypothetical protein